MSFGFVGQNPGLDIYVDCLTLFTKLSELYLIWHAQMIIESTVIYSACLLQIGLQTIADWYIVFLQLSSLYVYVDFFSGRASLIFDIHFVDTVQNCIIQVCDDFIFQSLLWWSTQHVIPLHSSKTRKTCHSRTPCYCRYLIKRQWGSRKDVVGNTATSYCSLLDL